MDKKEKKCRNQRLPVILLFVCFIIVPFSSATAFEKEFGVILKVLKQTESVKPLECVEIACSSPGILVVTDAKGRIYFRSEVDHLVNVRIGGAVGTHTACLYDRKGKLLDKVTFRVGVETSINDGGKISDMFRLFHDGMLVYNPSGVEQVTWNGKTYSYFVNWVLDNNNTMKGMQYFSPLGSGLIDLLRETQQPNGMIWSFVNKGDDDSHYFNTAYSPINFFRKDKDTWFVRQPVENHVEYNYVNMMYLHWKASGDNNWMKKTLDCAARALDYSVTDSVRWSKRFRLLKRPYCIDSWDFQVDDEYTPKAPISPTMVIVPGKTKFGVFFGDNTGYVEACNQLAEMMDSAGQTDRGTIYRQRAKEIQERLIALSWNGNFFTHFIDEDSHVKRNLGVDEKSQIAQGNMYSINRGLPHDMNVAIIKTYLGLREHLPVGSPGEWYSIYPPFEKGFGNHNSKWQYMNGGVAGHAAGELARGAYENGYENYASGILYRIDKLGRENGNRVWFSFTGSIPASSPEPHYKPLNISMQVNMDLLDQGSKEAFSWMNGTRSGNDMRGLPTGNQIFKGIPFNVIDPATNNRKAVIAVSTLSGFVDKAEIAVQDTAATVYLLHTSSDNIPGHVAGAITFQYIDGTKSSSYLIKGTDVTNWWFPSLENEHAGVAWWGPNLCSTKVGVCWAAIQNPSPSKKIDKLIFHAPLEGGIYAVLGITLSDRPHYVKPKVESYGGPDNWAASNAMAALVEGLAGVKNTGLAYERVKLSPRWASAGVDSVDVNVCFPASNGYVAYRYKHDPKNSNILMKLTGSGNNMDMHVLLPDHVKTVKSVMVNGLPVSSVQSLTEKSRYVDFSIDLPAIQYIIIKYE